MNERSSTNIEAHMSIIGDVQICLKISFCRIYDFVEKHLCGLMFKILQPENAGHFKTRSAELIK